MKLLELDQQITDQIRSLSNPSSLKIILSFMAHSADSWYWGAGLTLLYFIGPDSWQEDIVILLVGIVITATFVQGLKFLIRRPRPEGEWGQIYRRSDPHSFPSGHAARAFMLPVVILLTGNLGLGLGLLVWGILVGISRIALGVHFLSDILGGGAIGIFMGGLVFWVFSVI
jgi:undecaprenyl-diphosphatase